MHHVVIQLQFHFDSYMHERVSDAQPYFDLEVVTIAGSIAGYNYSNVRNLIKIALHDVQVICHL